MFVVFGLVFLVLAFSSFLTFSFVLSDLVFVLSNLVFVLSDFSFVLSFGFLSLPFTSSDSVRLMRSSLADAEVTNKIERIHAIRPSRKRLFK